MKSLNYVLFLLALIMLTAVSPPVQALACVSTGTGPWNNSATWTGCSGLTPQLGDTAQIQSGHTVTLDTDIDNIPITIDSGGILDMATSRNLGGSTITVNGTFRLNSGGAVQMGTATFSYGSDSTLNYNNGGTYNRGPEWSSGNPNNVQLSNNTTFDLLATTLQTMTGNLTIDNGSTFLMGSTNADLIVQGNVTIQGILELATGTGNMQVGGDWLKAPTPTLPPGQHRFKHNDSWVIFNGNTTQTIRGAMNGTYDRFDRIVVTNNSDVIYSNKMGVVTGLQVDAGSSFTPASNENFEQELNSAGVLTCAGVCVFNRVTMRRLDASGSTGIVDVNENFVIETGTSFFIAPPSGTPFTIAGNFSSANTNGGINFNGGRVQFDGGVTQTISGVGVNNFYDLVVGSGTILVDAANTAVTATNTFTNNGIFRRARTITATGPLAFGLTNVTMAVNSFTGSPIITVDRIDSDHPGATAGIAANSDRYWRINHVGGTFNVDVMFADETLANNTLQRTCRTADNGATWDCLADADPANTVTRRNGVTAFSDWQNCGACGPTAVSLTAIHLIPDQTTQWTLISLAIILALMTLRIVYKRTIEL